MKINVKSYSSQSSLISSIIYFIIGAILFTNADTVISFLSVIIGIVLAVSSIINLVIFYLNSKDTENTAKKSNLIIGIVSLVFAIIFIFFSNIVEQFIRFIIGAWILFSGIIRLINVLSLNTKNQKFIPLLAVAILLIAVGIYTIIYGDVIPATIGIIMMIYAGLEIVGYIFYTKGTTEPIDPGTTTLIVNDTNDEDIKEKNNNIKDVNPSKEKKKKHKKNNLN